MQKTKMRELYEQICRLQTYEANFRSLTTAFRLLAVERFLDLLSLVSVSDAALSTIGPSGHFFIGTSGVVGNIDIINDDVFPATESRRDTYVHVFCDLLSSCALSQLSRGVPIKVVDGEKMVSVGHGVKNNCTITALKSITFAELCCV
jgi:hypothetical protein